MLISDAVLFTVAVSITGGVFGAFGTSGVGVVVPPPPEPLPPVPSMLFLYSPSKSFKFSSSNLLASSCVFFASFACWIIPFSLNTAPMLMLANITSTIIVTTSATSVIPALLFNFSPVLFIFSLQILYSS